MTSEDFEYNKGIVLHVLWLFGLIRVLFRMAKLCPVLFLIEMQVKISLVI